MKNQDQSSKALIQDLKEMLVAWNTIETAARRQFPRATAGELYNITSGAMRHALGMK